MKNILAIILLLFSAIHLHAQTTTETLTNEKIVQLSKIGIPPSAIIEKIKTSDSKFDVSTDDMISLNSAGVAGEVISEMIKANDAKQKSIASKTNSNDPTVMHKSGIYYKTIHKPGVYYDDPDETNTPLAKLEGMRVTYKTSSASFYGYGGSSTTAILNGQDCKFIIREKQPIFYFYFEEKGQSDDWYQSSSPNEFDLVRCQINKEEKRLIRVGGSSSGMMSSNKSSGIPDEDKVPFDYKEISSGIYKITFSSTLAEGDYCFVFSGNTYKVFDFCVRY
jgi:hypothetical protein